MNSFPYLPLRCPKSLLTLRRGTEDLPRLCRRGNFSVSEGWHMPSQRKTPDILQLRNNVGLAAMAATPGAVAGSWVRLPGSLLWIGAIAAPYVLFMSLSGATIVFRNEVSRRFSLEWLVRFHGELLSGSSQHSKPTSRRGRALMLVAKHPSGMRSNRFQTAPDSQR